MCVCVCEYGMFVGWWVGLSAVDRDGCLSLSACITCDGNTNI